MSYKKLIIFMFVTLSVNCFSKQVMDFSSHTVEFDKKNLNIKVINKLNKKVSSNYELERFGPGVVINKFLTFPKSRQIFVDYHLGTQGSKVLYSCNDAYLFLISKKGQIIREKSIRYECSSMVENDDYEDVSFSYKLFKREGKQVLQKKK